MGRFDQDTSVMRERRAATTIGTLKPELPPQSKVRGIITGVLLGAIMWAGIIAICIAVWHRLGA